MPHGDVQGLDKWLIEMAQALLQIRQSQTDQTVHFDLFDFNSILYCGCRIAYLHYLQCVFHDLYNNLL